jgi:hypothetical protein
LFFSIGNKRAIFNDLICYFAGVYFGFADCLQNTILLSFPSNLRYLIPLNLGPMSRFVFITGGVVSSLGKGIASASLAALLQARGLSVTMIKLDPYINVDPGTMSPFQHGTSPMTAPKPTSTSAITSVSLAYIARKAAITPPAAFMKA